MVESSLDAHPWQQPAEADLRRASRSTHPGGRWGTSWLRPRRDLRSRPSQSARLRQHNPVSTRIAPHGGVRESVEEHQVPPRSVGLPADLANNLLANDLETSP